MEAEQGAEGDETQLQQLSSGPGEEKAQVPSTLPAGDMRSQSFSAYGRASVRAGLGSFYVDHVNRRNSSGTIGIARLVDGLGAVASALGSGGVTSGIDGSMVGALDVSPFDAMGAAAAAFYAGGGATGGMAYRRHGLAPAGRVPSAGVVGGVPVDNGVAEGTKEMCGDLEEDCAAGVEEMAPPSVDGTSDERREG